MVQAKKRSLKRKPSPRRAKVSAASRSARDDDPLVRIRAMAAELREHCLSYPGAVEEYPWGHPATKVSKKVFAFHAGDLALEEGLGFSVKLPQSGDLVLAMPFASPTGYGLGKSGWVSIKVAPDEAPPMEVMKAWIDESYRAVAPKKRVAELDAE